MRQTSLLAAIVTLAGCATAGCAEGGAASAPEVRAAAAGPPVTAVVPGGNINRQAIVRLNPRTGRPTTGKLAIGGLSAMMETSPDGRRLVQVGADLGAGEDFEDTLRFSIVDTRRWKRLGAVQRKTFGGPAALAWLTPDRLLYVESRDDTEESQDSGKPTRLVVIDPVAPKVLRTSELDASVVAGTKVGEREALVVDGPAGPQLLVVDAEGAVQRTVGLPGVTLREPEDGTAAAQVMVDAATGHVLVLPREQPRLVEVDPARGAATVHEFPAPVPGRGQYGLLGADAGHVAVSAFRKNAAGRELLLSLDRSTWRVTRSRRLPLDSDVTGTGGLSIVSRHGPRRTSAYEPDGRRRWAIAQTSAGDARAIGGRLYAGVYRRRHGNGHEVFSLRTGRRTGVYRGKLKPQSPNAGGTGPEVARVF